MGKRGANQKKDKRESKRRARDEYIDPEDMDDEIDAFHKQRDVVPLSVHDGLGESDDDDDTEHPVLNLEDDDDDDDDEEEEEEDEDEGEDVMDESNLTGLAAKIVRQQKYLWARSGGAEDGMQEEEDEEEEKRAVWGRSKRQYYDADEATSSDEDLPAEEEKEVLRLQREKAKSLSMEDFGFEDIGQDDSDREKTLEEIKAKGEGNRNAMISKVSEGATFEEVKKDLNELSREEQMDVLYSSAPELVGLLPELNNAVEELESRVKPLLSKVKDGHNVTKEGYRYLEIKQILLLSYCQAITFYLLLKSEGQPVRDHPVIARLVEIKCLLDKMKELDEHLPSQLEDVLSEEHLDETVVKLKNQQTTLPSDAPMNDHDVAPMGFREVQIDQTSKTDSTYNEKKREKQSHQSQQLGTDSIKMMKVRAALEEKLRQKGIQTSNSSKREKNLKHAKPINGKLETYDDFGDDAMERTNGQSLHSSKLTNLVGTNWNKLKAVSGDDDLPKRDDVGERRRKHELRVLARAGVESGDDGADENGIPGAEGDTVSDASGTGESEDEFYEQVKQQRAAKLAAKAEIFSRTSKIPSLPETVDGKRQISYQMEKNRGLTRARKKLTKNPRKKYRTKHEKAVVRRKGQVREIRKPTGSYGGEASGINKGISRSIRFKS